METQKLKYFLAVANEQNLTRASHRLNTVQSNVTVRLKQLEEEIGHKLFERSKKGMLLTEKGRQLVPLAKEIIEKQEDVLRIMNEECPPCGRLSVGCLESFIRISLKNVIPEYVQQYPEVQLEIQTGFNDELFSLLIDGEIDIAGIVGDYNKERFQSIFEHQERLILISNNKDYKNLPLLILGDKCILGKTLKKHSPTNTKVLRIGSIDSILHCVHSGIGVSLLPESIVNKYINSSQLFKEITPYNCSYSLIRKRAQCLNSCELKLVELINKIN